MNSYFATISRCPLCFFFFVTLPQSSLLALFRRRERLCFSLKLWKRRQRPGKRSKENSVTLGAGERRKYTRDVLTTLIRRRSSRLRRQRARVLTVRSQQVLSRLCYASRSTYIHIHMYFRVYQRSSSIRTSSFGRNRWHWINPTNRVSLYCWTFRFSVVRTDNVTEY